MLPSKGNDDSNNDVVDINTTQEVVPGIIRALFKANTELVTPSVGQAFRVANDPHMRLRRTLTPSLNIGSPKYAEAQFMIQGSPGKRIQLDFSVFGNDFVMDAYEFGASEANASMRLVALHGMSAGISRTRWHQLGERIARSPNHQHIRVIALDWHSIDRSLNKPQTDFLSLLPKHIFSAMTPDTEDLLLQTHSKEDFDKFKQFADSFDESTPHSFQEGGKVLRAVIEQGLGWGKSQQTRFVIAIKSWSGGVGMSMLADAVDEKGGFGKNLAGAIVMHPASFDVQKNASVVEKIPILLAWAKDDLKVPFQLSQMFQGRLTKLVAYESGGHANFDGESNLPNFDDDIMAWIEAIH